MNDPNLLSLDLTDVTGRLNVLTAIVNKAAGENTLPLKTAQVNNHVHTRFSFSPYYPSQAAYQAWKAGLQAVGIMDHDSVGGADEMTAACKIVGLGSTVGCEIRVNADGTALEGKKINNPDSNNILYMAIHGIAGKYLSQVSDFLAPITKERLVRNQKQTDLLNTILGNCKLPLLDFENDIIPSSLLSKGGCITERHILAALSNKLIAYWGTGQKLLNNIIETFNLKLPPRLSDLLASENNPHLEYDLLGILKSNLLPDFFIQPDKNECINVHNAVAFAREIHAVPAYAYLGDVIESPTGDKKAEQFEDGYLPLLFSTIKEIGFLAVTYMPPRNTKEQLLRVIKLCKENGLMEISGVDINSSRQSFLCPEILDPDYRHLLDSTWALIAHEKLTNTQTEWSMFHPQNPDAVLPLYDRIKKYSQYGRALDPYSIVIKEHPPARRQT